MGLKAYDLPPGGLENGAVATPSNDVTFTWTYDKEEFYKIVPTEKDIANVKNATPNLSAEEVLIEAKQKRYRKTKTLEFRKQYEEFEKEGKLDELPLNNIFNPKFQPETQMPGTSSQGGMSIIMRPQAAVHMMKVEIPIAIIDELNTHIDETGVEDFSQNLVGQINRNELSSQRYFGINDDAGKAFASVLEKLAVTYMKNVTTEDYDAKVNDAWTVHSYEGDYNPLHDHGSETPIGLSCILYMKVPEQIATPSKNDVTFTWVYDQEELDKIKPTEKDITNVKNATPNLSDEEVLIGAKQKRYRKTKTQEFRKQYNEYEKDGRLNELPLDNIFNPKFKPETKMPGTESQGGMSITMRPQAAVHMMKVEIPLPIIDELNEHIDKNIGKDYSKVLVGQINRNEKSAQTGFSLEDETGKAFSTVLKKLAETYMKNVTKLDFAAQVNDAWTVHSYEGDYNPLHDHGSKTPIGLSCIMYLKVPDSIANIPNPTEEFVGLNSSSGAVDGFTYFTWGSNGMRDVHMLRPSTEEYVKPEVGTLIMFPSWLRHSVNPFFGDGERRTFSANINIMKKVSKNEKTN